MYEIEIANNQERLQIDEQYLRDVVSQTLSAEQVSKATISIALLDNPSIHELNRQYLNHDFETDVLSFLLEESGGSDDESLPRGANKTIDGEIIVSADYATDQAGLYNWEPINELTLYVVHGLLHLCGYDDLSESELPIMRNREREIMSVLGIETVARESGDTAPPISSEAISSEAIASQASHSSNKQQTGDSK
jgi:probable rRNA maturation factor